MWLSGHALEGRYQWQTAAPPGISSPRSRTFMPAGLGANSKLNAPPALTQPTSNLCFESLGMMQTACRVPCSTATGQYPVAARTSDDFGLDVGFRAEGVIFWMCLTWLYAKAVKEMSSERIICKTLPCQRGISKEYSTCFARYHGRSPSKTFMVDWGLYWAPVLETPMSQNPDIIQQEQLDLLSVGLPTGSSIVRKEKLASNPLDGNFEYACEDFLKTEDT